MVIHYVRKVEGSPVVGFLAQAWNDLLKKKQWDNRSLLLTGDLQCVYATERNKIVGAITFFVDEDERCATVNLAYVLPRHRRKGILSHLWSEMGQIVIKQKAMWISNVCFPDNAGIAAFCKSVGGYCYTHQYRIDLD